MNTEGFDTKGTAHHISMDGDISEIEGVRDLGDFYFVPGLDSHGGDLRYQADRELENLKSLCRRDPVCVGFNTLGFLKSQITSPHQLRPSEYFSEGDGLYIFKDRYAPGYTFFGRQTPRMDGAKPIVQAYARPEPEVRDMLVILPFFNFSHSYRTVQNLLYVRETLRSSAIPYLVVEVAFAEEPFCLASASDVFQLRTSSRMFYKENLLKIGVAKAASRYMKFCFMDADILFSDPGWYGVVSRLLETHSAVQPYTNKYDLSPQFRIQGVQEYSVLVHDGQGGSPGLAWAVRRDWVEQYGIFDYCVIGSGDRTFTYCFGHQNNLLENSGYAYLQRTFKEYAERGPKRPAAPAPLTVFHLYHGSLAGRQYSSRDGIITEFLSRHNLDDIEQVLERRADGLLEWREPYRSELNSLLEQFFSDRNDDRF